MKQKMLHCPFCKEMVKAEYEDTVSENHLKRDAAKVGATVCGVAGAVLLFVPGFHSLGITALVGAGVLGKGSNGLSEIRTTRHYKCPNCGKEWEEKVNMQ